MIKVAQYKGKSLASRLIKFGTRGKYSHTAIILEDNIIVEAWEGCNEVRLIHNVSEGHSHGTPVDIYEVDIDPTKEEEFSKFITSQIGKKYDKLGLVAFYFNREKLNRENKVFCSELLAEGCHSIGCFFWGDDTKPWQLSPTGVIRSERFKFSHSMVTT